MNLKSSAGKNLATDLPLEDEYLMSHYVTKSQQKEPNGSIAVGNRRAGRRFTHALSN